MSFLQAKSSAQDNAPSPTPSTMSSSGTKRKRPVVASQPEDPHHGEHVFTRLKYASDHLKTMPDEWKSFDEIMAFLGVSEGNVQREQLRHLMRADHHNNRISWNASNETYRYKPKLPIVNAAQLKSYFQNQKYVLGLKFPDLKDGWETIGDELKGLENKKEILVKRNKDGLPKTVWGNDPSLMHPMAPEFANQWHKIAIPANPDELRNVLIGVGLTAASQARQVNTAPKTKKKKTMRRAGKQTNTHMAHLLKDFSGMRK